MVTRLSTSRGCEVIDIYKFSVLGDSLRYLGYLITLVSAKKGEKGGGGKGRKEWENS